MAVGGSSKAPREGQRWAHFEIAAEIARGNMGVVYRAVDTRTNQEIALKILVVAHTDMEAGERFKREARSLARLSHSNIVAIHSYGVYEGTPFLTMDYVAGATLQELVDRAALPASRCVDLVAQIGRALDHAHSRGVIHRDVKPANILIGPDGAPRITDFGLARLVDGSHSLTQDGDLVGTPVYMSPEQIQGTLAKIGPTTDVWALGVILYVALTGKLPFPGRTVDEVSHGVVQKEPAPPSKIADVPEDLERICLAAMRKDPALRYRSAGELVRDLEAYQRGRPVLAGAVTPAVRVRRAGRFLRLHLRIVAALGVACVLSVGAFSLAGTISGRAAERGSRALLSRSLLSRSSAWGALDAGEECLRALDPNKAAKHARLAAVDLGEAAALLDRAWLARPQGGRDDVANARIEAQYRADEIERGCGLDPVLGSLRGRIDGLRGRALAMSLDPATRDEAADCLERAFLASGRASDLGALITLAAAQVDPKLVERLGPLLARVESRVSGEWITVRAAFAALAGGEAARGTWKPYLKDGQPEAVFDLEAAWQLGHGHIETAQSVLPKPGSSDSPERLLLRSALARARGDWEAHGRFLQSLRADPGRVGALAELEYAAALLDRGRPSRALDRVEALRHRKLPPALDGMATLIEAQARPLAERPKPELLWGLMQSVSTPAATRLAAAQETLLSDPRAEVIEMKDRPLFGEANRMASAVRATRHMSAVEAAVGRVALSRLGISTVSGNTTFRAAGGLQSEAVLLRDDVLLAGAAALFLARGERDAATEILGKVAEPTHPAVVVVRRLLKANPWEGERPPRVVAPGPRGLWVARAALVAFSGASPEDPHRARRLAVQTLNRAIRLDPFHPAPRIERARLNLMIAAGERHADSRVANNARAVALSDAAAACACDPGAPEAWSLLFQSLWVTDRSLYQEVATRHLGRWTQGEASLEPHERLLLSKLGGLSPRSAASRGWLEGNTSPTGEAALRLMTKLVRAQGESRKARDRVKSIEPHVAARLASELETAEPSFHRSLMRAELALEHPESLESLLLEQPAFSAEYAQLADEIVAKVGARESAARALRLIESLKALPIDAEPEERARVYRQGRADLEGVARRRSRPGLVALRAVLEVWASQPEPADLSDFLTARWGGSLYGILTDLAMGRPSAPGANGARLLQLPQLKRLQPETP